MIRRLVLAAAALSTLAVAAEPPAKVPAAKPAAADAAKPAPAAGAGLALPLVGLTIDLPANSSVSKMMGMQMVQGGGTVVTVQEQKPGPSDAKDLAAAKKAAGTYSPTKFSREETLSDGYVLSFENKGSAGANYFVVVRRTIDGKVYRCETTASTPEQGTKAEAACLSLKKG